MEDEELYDGLTADEIVEIMNVLEDCAEENDYFMEDGDWISSSFFYFFKKLFNLLDIFFYSW